MYQVGEANPVAQGHVSRHRCLHTQHKNLLWVSLFWDMQKKFLQPLTLPSQVKKLHIQMHTPVVCLHRTLHSIASKLPWCWHSLQQDLLLQPNRHSAFALPTVVNTGHSPAMFVNLTGFWFCVLHAGKDSWKMHREWQRMTLQLSCIIGTGEHSGQGDGGVDENNLTMGEKKIITIWFQANCLQFIDKLYLTCPQSEQEFCWRKTTYLPYLTEMVDCHDLLGLPIQPLDDDVSAENRSPVVPSIIGQITMIYCWIA